jgi:hypothetical protein
MRNMTTLCISANVTRVKVRQLDEFIYSHLIQRTEGKTVRWNWDWTRSEEIFYGKTLRTTPEPEIDQDIAGILVQDIDTLTLSVNGELRKDFISEVKYSTELVIAPQDIYDYQYAMIDVSENIEKFEFVFEGTYFEDKLKFDISRVVLATGVECDIMYPFYDEEMFIPQNSVETQILRSYLVDPWGKRLMLQRDL